MTYKLATLSPIQIAGMDKLPIERQEAIQDQFGQPLVLSKVYYMLRDATANFTKPGSDVTRELDQALHNLLEKKGFFGQVSQPVEIVRTQLGSGKTDTIVVPLDIDVVLDGQTESIGFSPDSIRVLFLNTAQGILKSLEGIAPIQVVLNAERQIAYNENEKDNDHFLNLRNLAIWAKEVPNSVLDALEWLEARIDQDSGITGDARAVNDRLVEILRPQYLESPENPKTSEASSPEHKNVKTPYFSYSVKNGKVLLRTEYNPDVVTEARKLNGKWDSVSKVWAFDLRDIDRVKQALREIFGTDGDDTPDTVDVKVFMDNVPSRAYTSNYGHAVFALGRQLAHRKYHDSRVILGDNVTILEGGFADAGGTRREPRLIEQKGTILLVRDVPRKIVDKDELWCERCYEIVGPDGSKPVQETPPITVTRNGEPLDIEKVEGNVMTLKEPIPIPRRILGRKRAITLPNGEKHNAQFAIVELDDILASHNEETFADTPGYPRNAQGKNLNDRNYSGDKAAQQLVEEYARNLNPDLLIALTSTPEGTPIITNEGIVVSGNNRTMSLKLARKRYEAQWREYQAALQNDLDVFGFADNGPEKLAVANQLAEMQAPVLVRIDYDFGDLTTTNMAKYNASSMKGKRPIDRSIELSAKLVENALCGTNIPQIIGQFDTLSDFYADRNAQKQIRDQLIGCNLVTQQEMPAYYDADSGHFNDEGKTFIERTLAAAVLTADALQAADADGVKRLRAAVVNALPALLQNKGLKKGSLIDAVNDAILFQQKMVVSRLSFGDFLTQKSMFDTEAHPEQAVILARLMLSGQKVFKSALTRYNNSVAANTGDSLFATEIVSPGDAFERIVFAALPKEDQSLIQSWRSLSDEIEQKAPVPPAQDDQAAALARKLRTAQTSLKLLTKALPRLEGTRAKTAQTEIKLLNKFIERHTAA